MVKESGGFSLLRLSVRKDRVRNFRLTVTPDAGDSNRLGSPSGKVSDIEELFIRVKSGLTVRIQLDFAIFDDLRA